MTTVHFDGVQQDLVDFFLYHHRRAFSYWRGVRNVGICIAIMILVIASVVLYRQGFPLSDVTWNMDTLGEILGLSYVSFYILLLWFVMWSLMWPFIFKAFYLWQFKRHLRQGKNRALFGPRAFTINSESVSVKASDVQSVMGWKTVEKLEKSKDSIFIYASAASAWIIPRRAFDSDAAFQSFYEECQRYYTQGNAEQRTSL